MALLLFSKALFAQLPANGLDVKHYDFFIRLNDSNNIIQGKAVITTGFSKPVSEVVFDLVNKRNDGKGMSVSNVIKNGAKINFRQDSQHLIIKDKGLYRNEKYVYDLL